MDSKSPPELGAAERPLPVLLWGGAVFAALIVVVFLSATFFPPEGPLRSLLLKAVDLLKSAFPAAAMALAAWRMRKRSPRHASGWMLIGLGFLFYGLGDLAWLAFRSGFGEGGRSIGMTLCYLAFYPLFLAGVLRLPGEPLDRVERRRLALDMSTMVLAAGLALWNLFLSPALEVGGKGLAAAVFLFTYLMGDLALLWALLTLLLRRRERGWATTYVLLAMTAALLIAADWAYDIQYLKRTEAGGAFSWSSLGWTIGFLVAGLAALRQASQAGERGSDAARAAPVRPRRVRPEVLTMYVAFGCMAVALAVIVFLHLEVVTLPGAAAIGGMIVLVFLRQLLGLRENLKLYDGVQAAQRELEARVDERTLELQHAVAGLEREVEERRRAELRLHRQLKELSVLSAVAVLAVEAEDEETLLAKATETIRDHLYPDNCGVLLLDQEAGILRHTLSFHTRGDEVGVSDIPVGRGSVGRVVETGMPVVVPDVSADPYYIAMDPEMASEIAVPLKVGTRILGVLDAESRKPGAFGEDDERVLLTIANQLATALQRLRADTSLQRSEERFRSLVQNAYDVLTVHDARGAILYESPSASRILGYPQGFLTGKMPFEFVHPEDRPAALEALQSVADRTNTGVPTEYRFRRADGRWAILESVGNNLLDNPAVRGIVLTSRDITERKGAEDDLRESEARFRRLSDAAFEGIAITVEGRIVDANLRLAELMGYRKPEEIIGHPFGEFVDARDLERVQRSIGSGDDRPYAHRARRADGSVIDVEAQGRELPYHGQLARVSAVRDITERRRAEERIQLQIKRLAALRNIDLAINSSLDLHITLQLFLEHALAQLQVDAADVLLLHPETAVLQYAAGDGFRTDALQHSSVTVGDSYAGRSALEERVIHVPDLALSPDGLARSPHLGGEGFRSYAAAPLIVKGQVTGVLEVFTREVHSPDPEWMDFFQTLAGQAAIAIDNRSLFERIRGANRELAEAYDRTLEGWSRALELRDHETQGHTLRVVQHTLNLARACGMHERDLVHLRRGALLHDIGKMGIPDGILLKKGPLTEEEWVVMRRHPEYAFDLLWPIPFLRPALDVPYCHHERWDGTGYPRGLKGEEIPLAARVFSVVDSWDALSYDRPYRAAWPAEKVRSYLAERAGRQYDPRLVGLFLSMDLKE